MSEWKQLDAMPFARFRRWVKDRAVDEGLSKDLSSRKVKALASRMRNEIDLYLYGDARTWSDPTPEEAFKNIANQTG